MKNSTHPLYETWRGMRTRCSPHNKRTVKYYASRGITVCEEWDSFERFVADMGPRPEGMTLDRIDNDGPYCKANCRWATCQQQIENSRGQRFVIHNGERLNFSQLARKLGVTPSAICHRARRVRAQL